MRLVKKLDDNSLPPLIDHIGWRLWRLARQWKIEFDAAMAERGHGWMAEARGAVVGHLRPGGLSQSELPAALGISKQAVQQLVDELVAEQIVERVPDPRDGRGKISTDSGVLRDTQYSFSTRFENGVGTNPEELIAAAHAGCFSMALSAQLGNAGLTAEKISTTASVTLDKVGGGFAITAVHLTLKAKIPGADNAKFQELAAKAKAGCPVSKLLNAKITLDASLES